MFSNVCQYFSMFSNVSACQCLTLFFEIFQYFSMFFNVYYCLSVLFKASKCYHSVQKDVIHEGRRVERLDEILEAENVDYNLIEKLI